MRENEADFSTPDTLLRFALDASDLGTWELDLANQVLTCSRRYKVIVGAPPNDPLTYEGLLARIHPEDRERMMAAVEASIQSGAPYRIEYRVVRQDGSTGWVEARGRAYEQAGAAVLLVGTSADVTVRKTREAEMARQATLLRALASIHGDMITIKDREGRLLWANQAVANLLGRPLASLIGGRNESFMPQEATTNIDRLDRLALEAGLPVVEEHLIELIERKVRLLTRKEPFFGSNGAVEGVIGVSHDITDLRATERALQASEAHFRNLAEATPSFVYETNAAGDSLYRNPQYLDYVGITAEVADHWPWIDQVHPDDREHAQAAWRRAQVEGDRYSVEYRFRRESDGVYRWFHSQANPVRDEHGQIVRWLGTMTDIDELKRSEAALEQKVADRTAELAMAHQEMEAFSYSVAHDLRAPLRAIAAKSRILEEDFAPFLPEEVQKLLAEQKNAANRLGRLIDDLLRFSQIGRSSLDKEEVSVSEIAGELTERIAAGHPAIQVEIQPGMQAYADPSLLRSVLQNLLENAVKYSPEGGQIRVGQRSLSGETAFFVADEGIGFDTAFSSRLFKPFERLVSEARFPGTGIGLATVRRIVERHGGRVWAESELGHGSTFWFTLGVGPGLLP